MTQKLTGGEAIVHSLLLHGVDTPAGLRQTLEKAFAADAPALIEVQVERTREVSPWEFLMPPKKAPA